MNAKMLTGALGGKWRRQGARSYGSARCVVHDDHSPSLSIVDGPHGPIVTCFAGCDRREIYSELRRRRLLDDRTARSQSYRGKRIIGRPAHDREVGSAQALAIWNHAKPLGTLALQYFASRSITELSAVPDLHRVLRFHDHCPFRPGERHPCIVALWTEIVSNRPMAIHRTALNSDGTKLDRMSLGPTTGCIIRLWPDEAVTRGLVVGEGIETALAAATRIQHRGTVLAPAWATGDAGHLAGFPVLPEIDVITILVDHDENGRGQCAADKCARRWTAAGRDVIRLIPRNPGEDFADLVEVLA